MKVCDSEEVEEIVAKRLEQLENNNTVTDVKNKTLSLKVRAQPNQSRYPFQDGSDSADIKSELISEIKQMRDDFMKVNQSN